MSDSFNPELISTSKFVEMYYEGIVEPYCEGVEYEEYVRVKLELNGLKAGRAETSMPGIRS